MVTQDKLVEKTISNMVEGKSRGAKVMAVTTAGNYFLEDTAEFVCYIPQINPLFAGSLSVIPLQLISYYVSIGKECDSGVKEEHYVNNPISRRCRLYWFPYCS